MKLTQKDYDLIVFLTRLVYYDIPYPEGFKCIGELKMFNGLRLNVFDMERFQFLLCVKVPYMFQLSGKAGRECATF